MPIRIKIFGDYSLIVGNMYERVRQPDVIDAIHQVAADPNFRVDLDRLVFLHSDLDISETMLSDMLTIKAELIEHYFNGKVPVGHTGPIYKIAFIIKHTSSTTLLNLFDAVMTANSPSLVEVKYFSGPAEGLRWLNRNNFPLSLIADEVAEFEASS